MKRDDDWVMYMVTALVWLVFTLLVAISQSR